MQDARILERSKVELMRFVTGLVSGMPDRDGLATAKVPWSHQPQRFTKAEIPGLIEKTAAVLQAAALHAKAAPPWANPLPIDDELHTLLQARGPLHLLGLFSCSVMMMRYDYLAHPSFTTFGCGVMAHAWAPDHVRDDAELQCEFPAKELPGLSNRLIWGGEKLSAEVRAEVLGR